MSCHSEKVLCPYCGAEMEIMTVSHAVSGIIHARRAKKRERRWSAWTSCTNDDCIAEGPIVAEFETEQDARAEAVAAAMRRYTPPIKPMTLEEVLATSAEVFMEAGMFMEVNGDYGVWACRCSVHMHGKAVIVHYIDALDDIRRFADYGKTWRCWERRPTDEERSAAEWET